MSGTRTLLVPPLPNRFEPYTSNLYVRRTLAGEFVCVSRHLLSDLIARNIWTPELKNKLIAHNGSVQQIDEIPKDMKELYKTVWEISQKTIIDMAADRGAYIDQSQSLNIVSSLVSCRLCRGAFPYLACTHTHTHTTHTHSTSRTRPTGNSRRCIFMVGSRV
jgi:hypothetical protein